MAGVPHHALAQYLAKLVAQRFVVALAEQLEAPQPNRLVRRDVVRLVTPGTLFEEQLLEGGRISAGFERGAGKRRAAEHEHAAEQRAGEAQSRHASAPQKS